MAIACPVISKLRYILTVIVAMAISSANSQSTDTTWKKINFRGSAAFSVTGQHNWYGNSDGAISLNGGADLRYRKREGIHFSDHRFRGELAYLRAEGEEWVKSNDLLRLSFLW